MADHKLYVWHAVFGCAGTQAGPLIAHDLSRSKTLLLSSSNAGPIIGVISISLWGS
jgi:hypothetical protein